MLQESADLCAEADELRDLLAKLAPADWDRPTGFLGWTPWDVVAHLHFFDRMSLLALRDPEAFAAERTRLIGALQEGRSNAEIARAELGELAPEELTERWHATCRELAEGLGSQDPKRRLPWFGPDMSVRMFTTARFMETWAHAQEIYDLVKVPRRHTDRIRHVAVIGVKTFGWTFANRGLEVPGPPPYVRLAAPSGEVWEWNEPREDERVEGDAVDFCRVVTQVRNVADTSLRVRGEVARRWMSMAQCFAGGPADPPAPGERTGA